MEGELLTVIIVVATALAFDFTNGFHDTANAVATSISTRALSPRLVEIHRLENEGDRISRDAVASLFEGGIDPMVVIRWKDVFERLEEAIDACEHVSHILEGIVVKQT